MKFFAKVAGLFVEVLPFPTPDGSFWCRSPYGPFKCHPNDLFDLEVEGMALPQQILKMRSQHG